MVSLSVPRTTLKSNALQLRRAESHTALPGVWSPRASTVGGTSSLHAASNKVRTVSDLAPSAGVASDGVASVGASKDDLLSVDLDWLASVIQEAGSPIPMATLSREAVRAAVVGDDYRLHVYAPGRRYHRGDGIRLFNGRYGEVVRVERGANAVQGSFEIISLRLDDGELMRFAANVVRDLVPTTPNAADERLVDRILEEHGQEVVRSVRQAIASDPRFITLYDKGEEYGCLRAFFPPMSPDVLDAALTLILDTLFDQVPISRLTDLAPETWQTAVAASSLAPSTHLFSERELDAALRLSEFDEARARAAFEVARSLWQRASQHYKVWDAAQLDRAFVQPLLRVLGWAGVPLPGDLRTAFDRASHATGPVHQSNVLCRDEMACAELYTAWDAGSSFAPWALALAQTVSWGDSLDQPLSSELCGSGAGQAVVVPSHRMTGILKRTEIRWGILTSGRVWRLMGGDAHSLTRSYNEMDLGVIFDGLGPGDHPSQQQWASFRRWLLLFHRRSYVPGADGLTSLDRITLEAPEGSDQARARLRDRLLHVVLPVIAGGFVAYRRQRSGVEGETAVTLDRIYRASLVLLTRMVFVLAAEARGLLPAYDAAYHPHSLTMQAHWARERVSRDLPLNTGVYTTPRYDLMLALFRRISKGDSDKHLPCYGQLFFDPLDHPDHAFLEEARLSDQVVALALDALVRDIDYSVLDARDVSGAFAEIMNVYLTVTDIETGDVRTTRYEDLRSGREADGIWPDYVLKASVEQALVPVLDMRYERFVAAMERVTDLRNRLNRTLDRAPRAKLYVAWEAATREACQAFLGIRVCDPEMGAGIFLMSAVDVLADGIVTRLDAYHNAHPDVPRTWNPIYRLLDTIRRDVRDEVARQGIACEGGTWDDATILSRLIAQRSLFGVTRDPLGVEVARVGLWLHTFTWGAPFVFVDHHLQYGDGLLGAELPDVARDLGIETLSDEVSEAATMMYAIADRVDTTPLDVRWSASQFAKVREGLLPYRTLLDFWVEASQGDYDAEEALLTINDASLKRWFADLDPALVMWIAEQVRDEGHFHWELAFPEVFIDLASGAWLDNPGFDAVVGSPPWTSPADPTLAAYYADRFGSTATGGASDGFDVHRVYMALGRRLVRQKGGRTAYILSHHWLTDARGAV